MVNLVPFLSHVKVCHSSAFQTKSKRKFIKAEFTEGDYDVIMIENLFFLIIIKINNMCVFILFIMYIKESNIASFDSITARINTMFSFHL